MFNTDLEEAQKQQSDVLLENLSTNPYFKKSIVPNKSKALTTSSQFIVGAINEVKKEMATLDKSTSESLDTVYSVVGSITSEPDLVTQLNKVGENIILAIVALDKKIEDIKQLSSRVNYIQTIDVDGSDTQSIFKLEYKPCSMIKFFVNGILYSMNKEYIYNEELNQVEWTFDKIPEYGFEIQNMVVTMIYDYLPSENINNLS